MPCPKTGWVAAWTRLRRHQSEEASPRKTKHRLSNRDVVGVGYHIGTAGEAFSQIRGLQVARPMRRS